MPSKSPAQARLMAAVAHGWKEPGGKGPPVSVAKDFNQADKGTPMLSKGMKPQSASYAKGGPVIGSNSAFLKTPDRFREAQFGSNRTQEDWGKGSSKANPAGKDKSEAPVKPRK